MAAFEVITEGMKDARRAIGYVCGITTQKLQKSINAETSHLPLVYAF